VGASHVLRKKEKNGRGPTSKRGRGREGDSVKGQSKSEASLGQKVKRGGGRERGAGVKNFFEGKAGA